MGSFWGHIDEGLFFIVIAVWWTVHACRQYITSESKGQEMKPRISYCIRCCRRDIPVESILKTLFPIIGFMGEVLDGDPRFIDENGNFQKLVYAQHMTIYGIFILHGIIDLLTWSGLPMMPSATYMSAGLAFLWYGVAFYYHASMHGKEPLETIVHVIPIVAMFGAAAMIFLEMNWRSGHWTMLARSYFVLTLGTWFSHVAFMLYEHDKFPGGGSSGWDRSDMRNVQYARASFGLHLLLNMTFILLCYLVTYAILRLRYNMRLKVTYYLLDAEVVKPYAGKLQLVSAQDDDGAEQFLLEDSP